MKNKYPSDIGNIEDCIKKSNQNGGIKLSSVQSRFWARVKKSDGCWEWPTKYGRGQLYVNGRSQLVHRISFKIHFGEIPSGLLVCHHCDNPKCVRPDHLFLGTQKDNMMDCSKKGRINSSRYNLRKTHCPSGHPYDNENTRIHDGGRYCRKCTAGNVYRKRRKLRESLAALDRMDKK